MEKTLSRLILAVAGIVLLAACRSSPGPTPTPEPTEEVTATPEVIDECFRSASVEVYSDLDADGQRDEGEPPLEGIAIGLLKVGDAPSVISQDETDAEGHAEVGVIIAGEDCGLEGYVVGPLVVPAGYDYPPQPLADFGEVWEAAEPLQIGLPPEAASTQDGA